ncbi:hypothetical protein SELMODRAFT_411646 [Selaginella moellendorffii]|uniref:AP2/ERF domain-containing protein n=1 Tax=Selaginella moellendorffii TaxID=88036 RepID=D8RIK9_SELML|nr:hypothetical protein SELMODRAFT_411646 [Selaginella moellendorffii]
MPRSNPVRSSRAARPPQPSRRRPPARMHRASSWNELLAVEVLARGFQLAPGDFTAPDQDPNIKDTRSAPKDRSPSPSPPLPALSTPDLAAIDNHDLAAPSLDDGADPAATLTMSPVASAASRAPRRKQRRLAMDSQSSGIPSSSATVFKNQDESSSASSDGVPGGDDHPMTEEKPTSIATRAAALKTKRPPSGCSSSKVKRSNCVKKKKTVSKQEETSRKRKPPTCARRYAKKTSRYVGVSYYKRIKRWETHIWGTRKSKQIYVGSCSNEEAGARIYDRAYIKFRDKSCPNFPYSDYWINLPDKDFINMLRNMSRGESLVWFAPELLESGAGSPFTRETRPRASKYRGVYLLKGRKVPWTASITLDSRAIRLGSYETQEEAARNYDRAAIRFFGKAKALNFAYEDYTHEMPQWITLSKEEFIYYIRNSAQSSKKRKFKVHTAQRAVYDRKAKQKGIDVCEVNEAIPHYIDEKGIGVVNEDTI